MALNMFIDLLICHSTSKFLLGSVTFHQQHKEQFLIITGQPKFLNNFFFVTRATFLIVAFLL